MNFDEGSLLSLTVDADAVLTQAVGTDADLTVGLS